MKTTILFFMLLTATVYGQDSIYMKRYLPVKTHSQLFAISPMSKRIDKVNGLIFGLGHVDNRRIVSQTINGANIEANPAPVIGVFVAFMALIHLPDIIQKGGKTHDSLWNPDDRLKIKNWDLSPHLKINGLNISTGCFFTKTSLNGLNISLGNKFADLNGISITALGTISDKHNGLSIGLYNANNSLTGATIGFVNSSYDLKGIHIGVINQSRNNRGLQIGLLNFAKSKGFQLGLWNKNNKRSLPIFNW